MGPINWTSLVIKGNKIDTCRVQQKEMLRWYLLLRVLRQHHWKFSDRWSEVWLVGREKTKFRTHQKCNIISSSWSRGKRIRCSPGTQIRKTFLFTQAIVLHTCCCYCSNLCCVIIFCPTLFRFRQPKNITTDGLVDKHKVEVGEQQTR